MGGGLRLKGRASPPRAAAARARARFLALPYQRAALPQDQRYSSLPPGRAAPVKALTSALDAPEEVLEAALSFLQAEERPLLQALPNTAASLEVRFHRWGPRGLILARARLALDEPMAPLQYRAR